MRSHIIRPVVREFPTPPAPWWSRASRLVARDLDAAFVNRRGHRPLQRPLTPPAESGAGVWTRAGMAPPSSVESTARGGPRPGRASLARPSVAPVGTALVAGGAVGSPGQALAGEVAVAVAGQVLAVISPAVAVIVDSIGAVRLSCRRRAAVALIFVRIAGPVAAVRRWGAYPSRNSPTKSAEEASWESRSGSPPGGRLKASRG